MTTGDDEWLKAAMADDTVAADALMNLRKAPSRCLKTAAFTPEWSVRRRRSRPISLVNCLNKTGARASPTTPLSWSVATSFSGGCGDGGVEESSRTFKLPDFTRSKSNEESGKTVSKKSRKKKTFMELKEEENRLLKERKELKRDIAALCINLENQRAKNDSLKRMKIELQTIHDREAESPPDHTNTKSLDLQQTADFDSPTFTGPPNILPNGLMHQYPTEKHVLPDLNMPFDEEHSHAVICEVR